MTVSTQQVKDVAVLMYKGHTQASIMVHTGMSLEEVRHCQMISTKNPFDKEKAGNISEHDLKKLEADLYAAITKVQSKDCNFKDIDTYTSLKHQYAKALL